MTPERLGRYEITGTLGRGAMGVVYAARDPLIERTVAIKTIACAGLSGKETSEFEQRFFREAKSAGRLNHPNIVTVYDVGRDGELAWFAMELLSGTSLRDLLDAGEPLSHGRIVGIVAAVADALAFAHARGIVHRDVKPANIMMLESGVVKLADFGIAQLPGSGLTTADTVLGSPKYMSPEQIAGQKADGRSDIFSLGVVLYELLTGQSPFAGDSLHATMYQVVNKEVPAPSTCRTGLPAAFDAIVARAMAKDPAARYQDAAAMSTDLRRALRAPAAHPVEGKAARAAKRSASTDRKRSPAEIDAARRGRRRKQAALAGGIALAGVLALLLWWPAPISITETPPSPSPAQEPAPQPQAPAPAPGAAKGDSTATPVVQAAADIPPTPTPAQTSPDKPVQKPVQKPVPKPAEKLADKSAEKPAERSAATTANREEDVPGTSAPERSTPTWQTALGADLKACDKESVFRRIVCREKARWKHCPGHWGEITDCPLNTASEGAPR